MFQQHFLVTVSNTDFIQHFQNYEKSKHLESVPVFKRWTRWLQNRPGYTEVDVKLTLSLTTCMTLTNPFPMKSYLIQTDVWFVISGFMESKINNKAWYALKVWSSCDWLSSLFSKHQDDFD